MVAENTRKARSQIFGYLKRQVRAEAGKPKIEAEQETADPEKPLLIAAVDQSVDGCKVLVMKQDTSDIRPMPEQRKGPVRIEPAN